jgi:hypothetical protein
MGHWQFQDAVDACRPHARSVDGPQVDVLAHELLALVKHQSAGQQPGLAEDLKPVAHPDDGAPLLREAPDLGHDRRARSHGAAPEVVAVGKPARHEHALETGKRRVFVPHVFGRQTQIVSDGVQRVLIAVGAWKPDDRDFQFTTSKR